MKVKKGIILAGGTGTRLFPLTITANKHLLPIYDKPVIYYPLTTLMLAGIRDILIISTPRDLPTLKGLLRNGKQWGMRFSYQVQKEPKGLAEAFILGEKFINQQPIAMILGDNFFYGQGLSKVLYDGAQHVEGAHIFTYVVDDPSRYGIISFDDHDIRIEEKPVQPLSHLAITGLYYFDGTVSERAKKLQLSSRNELEITDLIKSYVHELNIIQLGRGYVWFDVGTAQSLLKASNYVEVIQSRQGILIASPEEVAWRMDFIKEKDLHNLINNLPVSKYQQYLNMIQNL